MRQKIIRTCMDVNYSNLRNINGYLETGWTVLMVNPIGNGKYLEYVLQKTIT